MFPNDTTEGVTWFMEQHTPNVGLALRVKEHLYTHQSPYQLIEIFDTFDYGKVLTLDKLIMITERDEFAYHEMLVHVPLLIHPNPRKILVIGGGDGGTLREIVKHPTVERIVQVEIDEDVVNACREYFPEVSSAYDDPRVELVVQDALKYVKSVRGQFDAVLIDSSDPVGPAVGLFAESFFTDVHAALNSDGIVSGQTAPIFYEPMRIRLVLDHLRNLFPYTGVYTSHIPSYPAGMWGFTIASKTQKIPSPPDEVRFLTFCEGLKYYNISIHNGSFGLPQYILQAIE